MEQLAYKSYNSLPSLTPYTNQASQSISIPFPSPPDYTFSFIDLFAGVGGFRLALQDIGGKCLYSSECNHFAKITYSVNFGEEPHGDITKEVTKQGIPKQFDILCAGFPCQAFSVAGYRKGFEDARGTLFFEILQIIQEHRPKVVFLENVKNLSSHNKGETFRVILSLLVDKLGYKVSYQILNSMTHANIPQNRERIFIVGFDPKQVEKYSDFRFPEPVKLTNGIHDILDTKKQDASFYYKESHIYYSRLMEAIKDRNTVYQWRRIYVRENKSNVCPTLTANMGTGGHNVPIIKDDFGIRKLTPLECFRFQGFPPEFVLPKIANSKLYLQAGNSVTVPLIKKIAQKILSVM